VCRVCDQVCGVDVIVVSLTNPPYPFAPLESASRNSWLDGAEEPIGPGEFLCATDSNGEAGF
jgi:hypothetical protein